jgi:hypothetical protein
LPKTCIYYVLFVIVEGDALKKIYMHIMFYRFISKNWTINCLLKKIGLLPNQKIQVRSLVDNQFKQSIGFFFQNRSSPSKTPKTDRPIL